ncbi:hypothetical protein KKB18_11300, partial [bacterium]|nr:hypothetical protein [bacterium]
MILVVVVIFFHEALFTGKVFYFYDNLLQNIPIRSFLINGIKDGKVPLWHSGIYSGIPIFAEGQNDIFFLPFVFLYIFLPVLTAYKLTIILCY